MRYPEFKSFVDETIAQNAELDPESGLFVVRAFGHAKHLRIGRGANTQGPTGFSDPLISIISDSNEDPKSRQHQAIISARSDSFTSYPAAIVPLRLLQVNEGFVYTVTTGDEVEPTDLGYLEGNPNTLVVNTYPTFPEVLVENFYGGK